MSGKPLSTRNAGDLIWLCRRLASSLQTDSRVLSALDSASRQAPASLKEPIRAMRARAASDDGMGSGLADLGLPYFVWGTLLAAEQRGEPAVALTDIADRLDLERTIRTPPNRKLYSYSLALGRLGLMLRRRVPILTALESAADSLPQAAVRDVMLSLMEAVRAGDGLGDALDRLAPDLPPMAVDMLRDGENDARLGDVLAIVSDYLLDEAGQKTPALPKKEV